MKEKHEHGRPSLIFNSNCIKGINSNSIQRFGVNKWANCTMILHGDDPRNTGCHCHCQVASVVSDSVQPQRRQSTRLPRLWDSPGKNTGVGYHCLLQCMKVKSESEVTQSCPTPSDPMDCSPPGSSIHGICQARVLEWVAIAFSEKYGLNSL